MEKSEIEQRLRLLPHIATIDAFWQYRLGTSAVRVVLALNEYCNETALPRRILEDADAVALVDLTNINICAVNDLLSARKELEQGSVESLIPILFATLGSVQVAADSVMETVRHSVIDFDVSAARLIKRYEDDNDITEALSRLIAGCRYYCTGNMEWR